MKQVATLKQVAQFDTKLVAVDRHFFVKKRAIFGQKRQKKSDRRFFYRDSWFFFHRNTTNRLKLPKKKLNYHFI